MEYLDVVNNILNPMHHGLRMISDEIFITSSELDNIKEAAIQRGLTYGIKKAKGGEFIRFAVDQACLSLYHKIGKRKITLTRFEISIIVGLLYGYSPHKIRKFIRKKDELSL